MMTQTCPYHPCHGRDVDNVRLDGYCPDCGRLAIRCTAIGCLAFNRPFLPHCRECGSRFREADPAVAIPEFTGERGEGEISVWHVCVDGALERWFAGNAELDELDSRMLVAEGVLLLQLSSGWIIGLHPAFDQQARNGPRVVLAQRPANAAEEVFPMQLVGATLVVATRRQIWQLPLAALWDLNNRSAPDWDGSLGPSFRSVFEAPPHWELACGPAPHNSVEARLPQLLLLLRQPEQTRIGRYAWVHFEDGVQGECELRGIAGNHVSCSVLSSTLVAVTTEQGQWLLGRSGDGEMQVQFVLEQPIATVGDALARRPANVVLRYELAGDARVFSFFVSADGRRAGRLYYYIAREDVCASDRVHPLAVPNGHELWPVAGLQGGGRPAVLCVQNNTLYRCELSGRTQKLANVPDVGHQGFWKIQVDGAYVHLLWKEARTGQQETCVFGLLECSDQLNPLFQKPLTGLRAMPVAWGRHLFVLQDREQSSAMR